MSKETEKLKKPDQISGDDYKIMIRIAEYARNHQPFNEYFDPIKTKEAFNQKGHLLTPEEKFNFYRTFPEAVAIQREAYSETFKIIELFLTENPDIDLRILDRAYVEMAKLYGFNNDLNNTYLNFRNYYYESREFMKNLEFKYKNKADLVEYMTGIKPTRSSEFNIVRGPFGFEIRLSQELINKADKRISTDTFYERLVEKIAPSTNLGGFSNEVTDYQTNTRANYIVYPLESTYVDFFRGFNDFLNQKELNKYLTNLNIKPQKPNYTTEVLKVHENQHALYNLIISAERTYSNKNVVKEIEGILKEKDPNKVTDEDFSNFCYFLTENAFFQNAADEILARLKDGNFLVSIDVINNPKVYNYYHTFLSGIDLLDNLFIEETVKKFLSDQNNLNSKEFNLIYKSYIDQAKIKIYNTTILIARFIQKYPNKNEKLTNILMFSKFENWAEEIKNYSLYLQKNQ